MRDYLVYDVLETVWARHFTVYCDRDNTDRVCEPRNVALRRRWRAFLNELNQRIERVNLNGLVCAVKVSGNEFTSIACLQGC